MAKTDKQLLVEARHPGKKLKQILLEAMEQHRGEEGILDSVGNGLSAGEDLKVSRTTVWSWCREEGIDVASFKKSIVRANQLTQV